MKQRKVPSQLFNDLNNRFPEVFAAHESLGAAVKSAGPLDAKTVQLVQLAAAGARGSEGAVHSHTRRALQAGCNADEIYHTLISLVSTIGFPQTMAAISWSRDIIGKEE